VTTRQEPDLLWGVHHHVTVMYIIDLDETEELQQVVVSPLSVRKSDLQRTQKEKRGHQRTHRCTAVANQPSIIVIASTYFICSTDVCGSRHREATIDRDQAQFAGGGPPAMVAAIHGW
jgi:hypothetical protein